jgi:hypothetical protein
MNNLIVYPKNFKGRSTLMKGSGMGSVLLNTNIGVGSTYTSAAANPGDISLAKGGALSKAITEKLSNLKVQQRKKPANIHFSI